jgi:multidrug resistance efflux pump
MIKKLFLPFLAVVGVVWAMYVVHVGAQQPPSAQPVAEPSQAPFANYVAGAGIVEAESENIEIGSIVPGVVTKVFVKYGDDVKEGDPLFEIDGRDILADLAIKKAALLSANSKLQKLVAQPRPEDVPPAQAAVDEAQSSLNDAQAQFSLYQSVNDKAAIVQDEMNKRKFAADMANARLAQAKANLAELKAGAWAPDIDVARADVAAAQAGVEADQLLISRLTVRAPITGRLLQVKIHPGEYAPAGVLAQPLMLMGNVDRLVVRTDVDENDAWRVQPGAKAVAFVRGNRDIKFDLTFFRIEPYVIPKKSLTGDTTERVDTRVLQVLYSFQRGDLPIYTGQQMDVYIESAK